MHMKKLAGQMDGNFSISGRCALNNLTEHPTLNLNVGHYTPKQTSSGMRSEKPAPDESIL